MRMQPKVRIVLDSNVYVSALLFDGLPELPIRLALAGKITILTSNAILSEVSGVLSSKFRWTESQASDFDQEIRSLAEVVNVCSVLSLIPEDDADNRILECAVDGKANLVITGDHHLLRLREYAGIRILTPREFAESLGSAK